MLLKEKKLNNLEYMFKAGFLGTRAPFFMDFVTLIVAFLPFLVAIAISFARHKNYKAHAFSQICIFAFSVIVLFYFEYGVRMIGGFNFFMKESSVSHNYAFIVLIFHIIISVISLLVWITTIFRAKTQLKNHTHKKVGLLTFIGVIATSLTGIWVYLLMFVF
jgi:putative membrane protein